MKTANRASVAKPLILLALALGCAAAPAAAHAGKRYAVLVGISEYSRLTLNQGEIVDLSYADEDALALHERFEDKGFDYVKSYIDNAANRVDVIAELSYLRRRVGPDDTLVFFFAGHGVRDPSNGQSYLLAHDTLSGSLDATGIRLRHLLDYIKDFKASRKILLLDHCYSGEVEHALTEEGAGSRDAAQGAAGLAARGQRPVRNDLDAQARNSKMIVLAATGGNDDSLLAYEHEELEHGFFTQAIIDALDTAAADENGDGQLDVAELLRFVPGRTKELSNQYLGADQVPAVVTNSLLGVDEWEALAQVAPSALLDAEKLSRLKEFVLDLDSLLRPAEVVTKTYSVLLKLENDSADEISEADGEVANILDRFMATFYDLPEERATIGDLLSRLLARHFGIG